MESLNAQAAADLAKTLGRRWIGKSRATSEWNLYKPGKLVRPVNDLPVSTLNFHLAYAEKALRQTAKNKHPLRERTAFWQSRIKELRGRIAALPPKPQGKWQERVVKPKPQKIPGICGAGMRKVEFAEIQECRRLHEREGQSAAVIAADRGHKPNTVQQWLSYICRVHA